MSRVPVTSGHAASSVPHPQGTPSGNGRGGRWKERLTTGIVQSYWCMVVNNLKSSQPSRERAPLGAIPEAHTALHPHLLGDPPPLLLLTFSSQKVICTFGHISTAGGSGPSLHLYSRASPGEACRTPGEGALLPRRNPQALWASKEVIFPPDHHRRKRRVLGASFLFLPFPPFYGWLHLRRKCRQHTGEETFAPPPPRPESPPVGR